MLSPHQQTGLLETSEPLFPLSPINQYCEMLWLNHGKIPYTCLTHDHKAAAKKWNKKTAKILMEIPDRLPAQAPSWPREARRAEINPPLRFSLQ
jgi:hypothetical protein